MTVKTYIVGGHVRDTVMNIPSNDVDYVMTGVTPYELFCLENKGYEQIGVDFPILLHPTTGEEYALARVERKVGLGYKGFECDTENVTLEQDLARRDLTINAMAYDTEDDKKTIIDPFGGQEDIKRRMLRHVSPAFAEDPVRVLRTARFAARFRFNVADETIILMQQMVKAGEVDALQRERVVQELIKNAEQAKKASQFIRVLAECNAWNVLFPEIKIPYQEHMYHIDKAVCFAQPGKKFEAFITMLFRETLVTDLEVLQARLVIPSTVYRFASRYSRFSATMGALRYASPREIVDMFDSMNILNNGKRDMLQNMINLMHAECLMTSSKEEFILQAYDAYIDIDVQAAFDLRVLQMDVPIGAAVGEMVRDLRITSVTNWKKQYV